MPAVPGEEARGTAIKQRAAIPANVTRGNAHQPGAGGAPFYHQKHLCTVPISPVSAVAHSGMLQRKREEQTNAEGKLGMKRGRKKTRQNTISCL